MHGWSLTLVLVAFICLPFLVVGGAVLLYRLSLKGAPKRQSAWKVEREFLERHPSLRRFQKYREYFLLPYFVVAVPLLWRGITVTHAHSRPPLWAVLIQLLVMIGYTWVTIAEARERKRLKRQDAEAGNH